MLNGLYIVGGLQSTLRPVRAGNANWNGYQQGVILRIDLSNGEWEECVSYVSPSDVCPAEDAAITFQAGTVKENVLYLCTQTEVIIYSLPAFEQIGYLTLPLFNDLHHVHPTPSGRLLIANAGLEMVLEVTLEGEIFNAWNVLGEEPWQLSSGIDYRKLSTKPHRSHPNYLFYVDQDAWVTRFHQGDTICLSNPDKRIEISKKRIHDGVVYDGRVYFTSVDGWVYIANPSTLRVEKTIDLNGIHSDGTLLGWCRSLLVDGDKLWVGFSRIRPTKWRENISWAVRGFKESRPTHISCYDLAKNKCVTEIDLEQMNLNSVYSIFPASG